MSKGIDELKEWAMHNVRLISILPSNKNLPADTKLTDVLERDVDEKYFLSEEKTSKLILNNDLSGKLNHFGFREMDAVHSTDGVSPTLNTMQGGNRQPKIAIREATKKGYTVAEPGDSVNISFPDSETRRGRVGKQIANTLLTGEEQSVIIDDTFSEQFGGVKIHKETAPTLRAGRSGLKTNDGLRIRKLTPLECFRLQGFTDEQFYKAKNDGVSDSQLYKQAGNSVSVPVIKAIAERL